MNDTINMTPAAELAALTALVESDGWRLVRLHLDQAWSDAACLEQIDKALERGSHSAEEELAITRRIRDTFKGVRAEARWVEQRIADLKGALENANTRASIVDRFKGLRRVP